MSMQPDIYNYILSREKFNHCVKWNFCTIFTFLYQTAQNMGAKRCHKTSEVPDWKYLVSGK